MAASPSSQSKLSVYKDPSSLGRGRACKRMRDGEKSKGKPDALAQLKFVLKIDKSEVGVESLDGSRDCK